MGRKRLFLLAQRTWSEFTADNCSQMAAAISYHALFATVPLTMFIISVVGMLAGTSAVQERITEEVTDYLRVSGADVTIALDPSATEELAAQYGPEAVAEIEAELEALNASEERAEERQHISETVSEGGTVQIAGYSLTDDELEIQADNLVAETLRGVVEASPPLSIVSFLILAYAATGLLGVVRRSLNFVWDVDVRHPFVQAKLIDLAMLFTVLVLIVLFLASLAATAALRAWLETGKTPFGYLPDVVGWLFAILLPWLISFLFCYLAFRFVPRVAHVNREVWPGAALVATGLELLKQGYAIYVANFSSYDVVYGALGGVLLFMLFVYLAAFVFLLGAELAAEYPRVMRLPASELETPDAEPKSLRQSVVDGIRGLFFTRRT
jgi:YihY family inner membrane protein